MTSEITYIIRTKQPLQKYGNQKPLANLEQCKHCTRMVCKPLDNLMKFELTTNTIKIYLKPLDSLVKFLI